MSHVTTGIVIDGAIRLHEPLALPDQTLVDVIIEPVAAARADRLAAWQSTGHRLEERPIHGDGQRFTRDELHERR